MSDGRYRAYPEYKNSGVEWAHSIPKHWDHLSLRWAAILYAGGTPSKDREDFWENGTIPWINSGAVNQKCITEPSTYISRAAFANSSAKWIPKRALVMALAGQGKTKGMVARLGIETTCNQSMAAIVPSDFRYSDYLYWWLESNYENVRNLSGGDNRDGLNLELLGSIQCPRPSPEEQTQIAKFLDHETAKIDRLIEKQEALIRLLKEKRQAVISHAVTKGLNPHAPLKDSGIAWLGQVPAHWIVAGFKKYLSTIVDYRGKTPDKVDSGVFLVTARNIKNGKIDYEAAQEFIKKSDYESVMSRGKPKIGDVLFTTEAPLGEVATVDREDIALAQRIIKFDAERSRLSNDYLRYLIKSDSFQQSLAMFASGSTALGIKAERFVYLRVLLPPIEEQTAIVKHIEQTFQKLEAIEKRALEQTTLLQERRTALISAAVTGKIDVRHWQPPGGSKTKSQFRTPFSICSY